MKDRILLKFLRNKASELEIRQVLEWVETSPKNWHYLNSLDLVDSALLFWGHRLKAQGFDAAVCKTFDTHGPKSGFASQYQTSDTWKASKDRQKIAIPLNPYTAI